MEIVDNLKSNFIATVYNYDTDTRKLEVFIPKLMPIIPEGQKERTSITNLGNNSVSIKYNKNITLASTVSVPAFDCDTAIPDKNSKVLIDFFDGEFELRFWRKFNPTFLSETIEEEKYPRHFYLKVNDKKIPVNLEDEIILNIPGYSTTLIDNGKKKILNLIPEGSVSDKLEILSDIIGNEEYEETNNNITNTVEASGIMKDIKENSNKISDLEKVIEFLINKINDLENNKN